jgi:hypothetical protein
MANLNLSIASCFSWRIKNSIYIFGFSQTPFPVLFHQQEKKK